MVAGTAGRVNPSVASSDSSPFRRACTPRPCLPFQESPGRDEYASPERGGACCAGGGVQNEEFGNFNVWFPNSSIEPAAASGSGHCPAAAGGSRQRRLTIRRKFLRIRRPWPLQPMAANGRRQNPRQHPAVGPADRQQVGAGSACPVVKSVLFPH